MPFNLADIAESRQEELQKAIETAGKASNDGQTLQMLLTALDEVRDAVTSSVADKVTVTNQDVIKAEIRNSLNKLSKNVIAAIDKLALDKKKLAEIKTKIEADNAMALTDRFDIAVTPKPKARLTIANLSDIAFPDSLEVRNLGDLQKHFDDLANVMRDTFNIDIPTPQVTVQAPEVNIPESSVNVDAPDLGPLLKALTPLKFLSDRAKKPLAVRLSDGQKFIQAMKTIVDNQQKQVTAFSQGLTESALRKALKASSNATLSTSALFNNNTELTPKFAVIDAATSGNNTIVAAVSGKKIRVVHYSFVCSGTVNVRFESGADGTALTGQENFIANTGSNPGFCPVGHFETAAGELLNMELSGAVSVDGHLTYIEV